MYSVRSVRPLIDVDDMRSPTDRDTLRTVGLLGTEKFSAAAFECMSLI